MPSSTAKSISRSQSTIYQGVRVTGKRARFDWVMLQGCEFADHIGKSIRLLYYPPYHRKYNPVVRCWGIWEQHWNGAKLTDAKTMLEWAQDNDLERRSSRRPTEPHCL
ncbi:MAG: hypothetical protein DVS81_03715 [Candidatus Accumulibacter meliphilus]|uniref:Transposase n=1 Tax=Candidatus Accumulibacter meliphilus TaxID=2211374 RepID=A0A369XP41_9PROT|nr:MAG: hypothetical protein DVS81_03715 [Candidatus Accumulibacter meliphilus]